MFLVESVPTISRIGVEIDRWFRGFSGNFGGYVLFMNSSNNICQLRVPLAKLIEYGVDLGSWERDNYAPESLVCGWIGLEAFG